MLRSYRKPLVIAAPKMGLKLPQAVSEFEEMGPGTSFKPIYVNEYGGGQKEKVILCSGKVFFDIDSKLNKTENLGKKVKVIRVEELAPFPVHQILDELKSVSKDTEVTWVQEES